MARICLVGESKTQRKTRTRADQLFTGTHFVRQRTYAQTRADQWFILSARYGLLEPGRGVDPYERVFSDLSSAEQFQWAQNLMQSMSRLHITSHDTLVILAKKSYQDRLLPIFKSRSYVIELPLAGMSAVQQLRWLAEMVNS